MVCPDCGTRLTDSDQFCPGCGAKIIRKRRCPECGETLREGVKFCPGCGSEMSGERRVKKAALEDAPGRKTSPASPVRKASPAPPVRKASAAPPPKKKQAPPKSRDWEDEDDDYDDDEESVDILSIMTVAVGCILLVILAVLGFNLYKRYMPKDYEKIAKEQEAEGGDGAEDGQDEPGEGPEGGQELPDEPWDDVDAEEVTVGGTLVTTAAVNIRDNPSTDGTTVITKAKAGETYEYTEAVEGGSWYRILLPDEPDYEYGYVYADYVRIQ